MATKHHVAQNRDYWNSMAENWVTLGERLWSLADPQWGIWGLPEAELALLPTDMRGLSAIELGCGTGYVSGWMARRGASVTGIDVSEHQLATARRLAHRHDADITFIEGNAEAVDQPGNSFDFAISELGAAIWCDPDLWLREAWRLLRPGGTLVFLGHHPLGTICSNEAGDPCDFQLHRSYRTLSKQDWTKLQTDPGGVEFSRPIAGWMDLFREIGFEITGFQELYAPEDATGLRFYVSAEWAKQYPAEQVWKLRKPA